MPLDLESLRSERDRLKETLRALELDQRKIEAELKVLRQREIQTKREIEALTTLIEIQEPSEAGAKKADKKDA